MSTKLTKEMKEQYPGLERYLDKVAEIMEKGSDGPLFHQSEEEKGLERLIDLGLERKPPFLTNDEISDYGTKFKLDKDGIGVVYDALIKNKIEIREQEEPDEKVLADL